MLIHTDIDGVLADPCELVQRYLKGTGKPANWAEYFRHTHEILPVINMLEQIERCIDDGHLVVFTTGRPESNRQATLTWLRRYMSSSIPCETLLMRKDGNHDPGALLKLSWALTYHPSLVVDDEPDTVNLLRSKGFKVVQIYGHRYDLDTDGVPA
jgi:hypothetical protein